ncbi:MAG: hypothetical protein V7607_3389 [Solirubrobacteraceae bacterium]
MQAYLVKPATAHDALVRIGLVTDVHRAADGVSGGWHNPHDFLGVSSRLERALAWFRERDVEVCLIGGDLAHAGDVASMAGVLDACSALGTPVLVVAGNHDVFPYARALARATDQVRGADVTLASPSGLVLGGLRVAGVHVGVSDGWFGSQLASAPDVEAWGAAPTVLLSHFPLLSRAQLLAEHGFPYPGDLLDRRAVADRLLGRAAATVVLSGHIHARDSCSEQSVLQLSQGALIEAPYECAVIDVAFDATGALQVRRESRPLAGPAVAREPIFAAATEAWTFDGSAWSAMAPGELELLAAPPAGPPRTRAGGAQEVTA